MRFVAPYRSIMFAPVSGDALDANFERSYLTDGLPGFPVKKTGGSLALTVTPSAALDVDVIAVCHHDIREAATIALSGSGGFASSIVTAAYGKDNIPKNLFRLLPAPVNLSSLAIAVTGNTDPVTIGELYAGRSHAFDVVLAAGRLFDPGEPFEWEGEIPSLAPNDPGYSKLRRLAGELILDDEDYAELQAWDESTLSGTRPSLVIPDDTVNDAWLCAMRYTEAMTGGHHFVSIEIAELPRPRW